MFVASGKKQLTRSVLREKIEGFLLTQPVCVLATSFDDVPRASAVEFFPDGLNLYILTEGGKKLSNIKKNPAVALEIFAPYTGWGTVQGMQITGTAETGKRGTKIFEDAEKAYARRRGQETVELPGFIHVIKVTPNTIEYLDARLAGRGYSVRQVFKIESVKKKKTVKTIKKTALPKKKTVKAKKKATGRSKTAKKKVR